MVLHNIAIAAAGRVYQHLPGKLAARLIAGLAKTKSWQAGRPTILVLDRGRLSLDVEVLSQTAPINLISIKALRLKGLLARHVAPASRMQTLFQREYLEGDRQRRAQMQALVGEMVDAIQRRYPIDAVLAGNIDYWPDEAVKDVCQARGIPFLVLCRENYVHAHSQRSLAERFQSCGYQFRGAGIAMASSASAAAMVKSGITQAACVESTGWPRFDRWITEPIEKRRPFITLVSYFPEQYRMQQNARDVMEEFIAAARRHRGKAGFAIKVKKKGDLIELVLAFPSLLASGIELVATGPMQPLLRKSTGVIGAGSMGIVEAYLADAAVIVPWWADARQTEHVYFHPGHEADNRTTYFPISRKALREQIDRLAEGALAPLGSRTERLAQFGRYVDFDETEPAALKFTRFVKRHLPQGTDKA